MESFLGNPLFLTYNFRVTYPYPGLLLSYFSFSFLVPNNWYLKPFHPPPSTCSIKFPKEIDLAPPKRTEENPYLKLHGVHEAYKEDRPKTENDRILAEEEHVKAETDGAMAAADRWKQKQALEALQRIVEVWQHVEERVEELYEAVEDLRQQVGMIKQHAVLQDATTTPRMPEAEDADQNKSILSTPSPELRIGPSGWSPFCSRSLGTGLRVSHDS